MTQVGQTVSIVARLQIVSLCSEGWNLVFKDLDR